MDACIFDAKVIILSIVFFSRNNNTPCFGVSTTLGVCKVYFMFKHFLLSGILLILCMVAMAQPPVGYPAPNISLADVEGKVHNLSELKGKVVLLDFWASWCGPCRSNNKQLKPLYAQYKDKGLEVFGVSIDVSKSDWKRALDQDRMDWLQVIDTRAAKGNQLAKVWNLQYIPATFLIDRQGKIAAIDPSHQQLENLLNRLL